MLKPLVVPGQRANDELEILFHRNDPKNIYGGHGNPVVQTERQPDLIVTSVHSARRAAGLVGTETWPEIAKQASEKPHCRFQWYDVLCVVELKYTAKIDEKNVDGLLDDLRQEMPVPPHFVKLGPNPKKRTRRSESTLSAAGASAKRVKTERSWNLLMPRSQLAGS